MSTEDKYKRAYERERQARRIAENVLNEKTREVYDNLLQIKSQNETLNNQKKELELLIEVANLAKEDLSFGEGLSRYLIAVAKLTQTTYGLVYLKSKDSEGLFSSDIIYPNDESFPESLKELVKDTTYFSGKSIPGKVLQTKDMLLWKVDSDDEVAPMRVSIFKDLGLKGSFSVPIICFDQVIAVAEFGVKDFQPIADSAYDKIKTAAIQLGGILERRKQQKSITKSYTELKKTHDQLQTTQGQLIQSEKMASLGQIAAGVAHEINNPIGFVTSNLETLQEYINLLSKVLNEYETLDDLIKDKKTDKIEQKINLINQIKQDEDFEFVLEDLPQMLADSSGGLVRVKEIVANLKTFAHADDGTLEEHDINECLENSLKVVWNELKYTITVKKDYAEIPRVECSVGELSQVFMNLMINAKDACGDKGEIYLSTDLVDNMIEVRVCDNGEGIPEDVANKIFDPFFTTKPIGKGTGLGLSVSYGIIVEKHAGTIEVDSEVDKGTCFIIKLPTSR